MTVEDLALEIIQSLSIECKCPVCMKVINRYEGILINRNIHNTEQDECADLSSALGYHYLIKMLKQLDGEP